MVIVVDDDDQHVNGSGKSGVADAPGNMKEQERRVLPGRVPPPVSPHGQLCLHPPHKERVRVSTGSSDLVSPSAASASKVRQSSSSSPPPVTTGAAAGSQTTTKPQPARSVVRSMLDIGDDNDPLNDDQKISIHGALRSIKYRDR